MWAGVDSAGEQEKREARKMPENAAESHTSGTRFVSLSAFYTPNFVIESGIDLRFPLEISGRINSYTPCSQFFS